MTNPCNGLTPSRACRRRAPHSEPAQTSWSFVRPSLRLESAVDASMGSIRLIAGSHVRAAQGAREAAIKERCTTQRTAEKKNSKSPRKQANLSNSEQSAIYHGAAHKPLQEIVTQVTGWHYAGSPRGDGLPAADVRPDAGVEADQGGWGLGFCEHGDGDPGDGCDDGRRKGLAGEDAGLAAVEWRSEVDDQRGHESCRHRGDLAPGVDAPPIPPQQVDAAGA